MFYLPMYLLIYEHCTIKGLTKSPLLPYQITLEKLTEAYETCISSLRKSQAERRNMSLNRISPTNFTKEVQFLHKLVKLLSESVCC